MKQPVLDVVAACRPGEGIIELSENQISELSSVSFFGDSTFFIPASGMGSRMFGFLFQFISDGIETEEVKKFFRNLEHFPFYDDLIRELGDSYSQMDQGEIVAFILSKEGLGLAEKPKGLIPFHKYSDGPMVPFEEHLLQIQQLNGFPSNVNFSVQEDFLPEINDKIKSNSSIRIQTEYSFQDPSTDAYCFDEKGDPIRSNGDFLRRPAGHGALLKNLNKLDESIVFIKNIDNLQSRERVDDTLLYWRVLNGLLTSFKSDLSLLKESFTKNELISFNEKYQQFREEDIDGVSLSLIEQMCDRPSRVCGMVINEGAPGGGPFWVKQKGISTRQIVEKVQFGNNEEQLSLLSESTHFNPVFMVADKVSVNGLRCDLNDFIDHDAFIRVEKDNKGEKVVYHELPGLWNGSMAYWNTVFVEVPKTVFTPVKTVLDLIGKDHLSQ